MLQLHDYKLIHILVLKKKHYYKINLKMKSKKTQKEDNALKLVTRMALPDDRGRSSLIVDDTVSRQSQCIIPTTDLGVHV